MTLDRLLTYVVKIAVYHVSVTSFSLNNLFRSFPNGNCLFSSASLPLVEDNLFVHEHRVMAVAKVDLVVT